MASSFDEDYHARLYSSIGLISCRRTQPGRRIRRPGMRSHRCRPDRPRSRRSSTGLRPQRRRRRGWPREPVEFWVDNWMDGSTVSGQVLLLSFGGGGEAEKRGDLQLP